MIRRAVAILFSALLGLQLNIPSVHAQAFPYRFAFMSDNDKGVTLTLLDPQNPAVPSQIELPLSSFLSSVSPDGRWIVTGVSTGHDIGFPVVYRLFDTQTGQTRDLLSFTYDDDCSCSQNF